MRPFFRRCRAFSFSSSSRRSFCPVPHSLRKKFRRPRATTSVRLAMWILSVAHVSRRLITKWHRQMAKLVHPAGWMWVLATVARNNFHCHELMKPFDYSLSTMLNGIHVNWTYFVACLFVIFGTAFISNKIQLFCNSSIFILVSMFFPLRLFHLFHHRLYWFVLL